MWKRTASTGKVAVTGASGFLGSMVTKLLLEKGYTVHATVRDTKNKAKTQHLLDLPNAKNKLLLFQADLLDEGAFDKCIKGCVCVFHTATPFFIGGKDYTRDFMCNAAVGGTVNVLKTCQKYQDTVQRVVLTSSTAAVYTVFNTLPAEHIYTEKDWSPLELMEENKTYYMLAKTLAEKAAWDFVKDNNSKFDLVTIQPTIIWGKCLQPALNTSTGVISSYVNGQKKYIENGEKTIIDVIDTADAHICAWEDPTASGRYLMMAASVTYKELCEHIKSYNKGEFSAKLPTEQSNKEVIKQLGAPYPHPTLFDCSKVEKLLGRKLKQSKEIIDASLDSLKTHGHIK